MKSHRNEFFRLLKEKLVAHNRAKQKKVYQDGGVSSTTYAKPMGVSAGEQKNTEYNNQ